MQKEIIMEINHETAMSLWTKRYGKVTRIKDFAGREMDKGSYGNRNSDYGWNLDHILPQSQGGKDTDSNLICCHILTNDEKADKYPVFTANKKTFEIVKVENHHEIREKNPTKQKEEEQKGINFFDHSAGIRFFKKCKDKDYFVGTINIKLSNVTKTAIFDFIKEMFDGYDISFRNSNSYCSNSNTYEVSIIAKDLKTKDLINGLLDDCILLNTYLGCYFKRLGIINSYDIRYGVYCLHDLCEIENFEEDRIDYRLDNVIHINELVRINSEASKMQIDYKRDWYSYDIVYTKLADNLRRVEK